ncbi:variable surface protein [Plasmodium gonderi]|uniref:Variable surface protein n=1 Tax=Plasmodium gonderi TaxID=77519 RepID=A0A1Y1JRH6_PLAGO|nr:variable surface protein [Plasmodium gonderi]GAW84068.1 variable surface protein [Plasmodium gonderi]
MLETMFEYIELFPKCEEIIDKCKDNYKKESISYGCNTIKSEYEDVINSNLEDLCGQSMKYLNEITIKNDISLEKAGFTYFYYWLYMYKVKKTKTSDDIKPLYMKLINLFNDIYNHTSLNYYAEYNFTDAQLQNLKNLFEMQKTLILIKAKCKPNENYIFCNAIKNIIDEYNSAKKIEPRETYTPKELNNCKYNISIPILTTIGIMLLIISLGVIVYKFTPYDSWLTHSVKGKRNVCNNEYDVWNKIQTPDTSSTISCNEKYNILYNYS